ncbi:MAG: TetR family transcriptional regulator [Nocardia sp.]|uniref:TetR/AcrR family transcriptional regulator n=1 Tax=Nocardia sp. TaxID=1821 RepID=UPI00260A9ABD|nr:TetR/AcrR family transcriptional regulator [Nocardia sp.]MCU1642838.1 TetR family transcriptional regulator [Nocardia sp.]
MVSQIIDAGETVLITHGYEAASTNRIAHTAGISPGSLYRHFPNKDAIVTAVVDRYNDEVVTTLRRYVFDNLTQPLEIAVPAMISVQLDALADRPELLRAVMEQTPRLSASGTVFAFEQQISEVARTVQHLTIRYILDRPAMVRAHFVADLTRLVRNFVQE